MLDLALYFRWDAFATRPLLRVRKFRKKAAKKFELPISLFSRGNRVLERLEKQNIVAPFLRVELPRRRAKVRETESGKKQFAGFLEENEDWEGETEVVPDRWTRPLQPDNGLEWIQNGWLVDPRRHEFIAWDAYTNDDGDKPAKTYYSIFQIYELFLKLKFLQASISLSAWQSKSYEERLQLINSLNQAAELRAESVDDDDFPAKISRVCQLLSTAYYSRSKSDARQHWISIGQLHWQKEEGKYGQYQEEWSASELLAETELDIEQLGRMHRAIEGQISSNDPLSRWSDLVQYVDPDKREDLQGKALLAELFRRMRFMLEQFIADLNDEPHPARDRREKNREEFYGADDRLEHLEYLTNRYNINPRPSLILVVEGETEARIIPELVQSLWGFELWRLHIKVLSLRGISKFTGDKEQPYGALEKFIDYHHSQQTLVYVIVDNESRAAHTRGKLLDKKSDFVDGRELTREEYLRIWEKSLEFDNFSDGELAEALTSLAGGSAVFSPGQISELRESHGERGKPFQRLFEKKTGHQLDKMKFVTELFTPIFESPEEELTDGDKFSRPILKIISDVIEKARRNVPPANKEVRRRNQEGGFFGKFSE